MSFIKILVIFEISHRVTMDAWTYNTLLFCPNKLLRTFMKINCYFLLQTGFNCFLWLSSVCWTSSYMISFAYLQNAILGMSLLDRRFLFAFPTWRVRELKSWHNFKYMRCHSLMKAWKCHTNVISSSILLEIMIGWGNQDQIWTP